MPGLDVLWPWCAAAVCAVWLWLLFGHGRFWLADQRLEERSARFEEWPGVVALVPARNEAEGIAATLGALLDQDYPGNFWVFVSDDESEDDTAAQAQAVGRAHPRGHRLDLGSTPPRPEGWVGKMWALHSALEQARARDLPWDYVLLCDADIVHPPGSLRRLVAKARAADCALVSLMVKLDDGGRAERLLIPAFVYFFQQLYPFPWVNDPASRTAAAAGGCVLLRRDVLERIGGFASIRGEIIDDCALAARVKREAPIWLGLTDSVESTRPYGGLDGVWAMVSRTAFTQLRHSWFLLVATVVALLAIYLLPVLGVLAAPLHRDATVLGLSAAAWGLQALSFAPTLALYGRHPLLGFALPLAGALYTAMTIDSALQHRRGTGAMWKSRSGGGAATGPASGARGGETAAATPLRETGPSPCARGDDGE